MEDIKKTAQDYLDTKYPQLAGATISVTQHGGEHDKQIANLDSVKGVMPDDVSSDIFHIATVSKEVPVEGGTSITKTVHLRIKDGAVQSALESKSV